VGQLAASRHRTAHPKHEWEPEASMDRAGGTPTARLTSAEP
jgi:hypothetical protein